MHDTARLAGFFAAHAIWNVSDPGPLTPILGWEFTDGKRGLQRISADTLERSVEIAQGLLRDNPEGARRGVLIFDGYTRIPEIGRTDALFVDACEYPEGSVFTVVLPYRNAEAPSGFAVLGAHLQSMVNGAEIEGLRDAFVAGADSHEKGAAIWRQTAGAIDVSVKSA